MTKKPVKKEDSHLFQEAIGKVIPVKADKHPLTLTQKPKPYPKKSGLPLANKLIRQSIAPTSTLRVEDTLSYTAEGIQHSILRKMRRGHFGLDAELDLHGLTSNQAKRELVRFLHFCEQDGCRCVRIIHGKGYRSANNLPVLKNDVNLWLRQHQEIQAFCSASQKEGGTGAVLVLLRLSDKYGNQEDTKY